MDLHLLAVLKFGIPIIIFISIFIYWNIKISKEIQNRKDAEFALRQSMARAEDANRALKKENASREKIEGHLKETIEKAEAANKSKSEFLANMSHEIRTPMNAVLGFTDILKRKESDKVKLHYINNIESSGRALLSLINDILDLSKIEAGKQDLQYSVTSLEHVMKEMSTIFEQKAADKGIKLVVECDVKNKIIFDETRLRQIFINLISNALKFTEKGFVKLTAEMEEYDEEIRSGSDLIVAVEDTGIGIPKEQQNKIFDAFEQVKGQKIAKFGGTGLGLAIIMRLIEMLNGEIKLFSEPGEGSKFQVTFHDVEKTEADYVATQRINLDVENVIFEPAKILVADDIDYNRELIRSYFEGYALTTVIAETGTETIEAAHEYKPDLILLDMKMPEMDGYEVSGIIKNTSEMKKIPIIAVTASALKQDEDLISNLCDGYLRKPISQDALFNELMKFLPYRIKEDVKTVEEEEVKPEEKVLVGTSGEISKNDARLKDLLKKKLREIEKLHMTMSIDAMKTFSKELKEIGDEFHVKKLITWCEELHFAAVMFDADKITASLDKFPDLVNSIGC